MKSKRHRKPQCLIALSSKKHLQFVLSKKHTTLGLCYVELLIFEDKSLRMWLLFQLLNLLAKTAGIWCRWTILNVPTRRKIIHSGILFNPGSFLHDFGREKLHLAFKSIVKTMFELFVQRGYVCTLIFSFPPACLWKKRSFEQKHNKLMSSVVSKLPVVLIECDKTIPTCMENAFQSFIRTTLFSWNDFTVNLEQNKLIAFSFGNQQTSTTKAFENPMVGGVTSL